MNEENKKILNALNVLNVGHEKLHAFFTQFENMHDALRAPEEILRQLGCGGQLADRIVSERKNIDIEKEWEKLEKHGIYAVGIWEDEYPALLREIYAPPPLLYVRGDLFTSGWNISVVGARKPSAYGKDAAKKIVRELAPFSCNIISGLAYGIDTVAHEAALASGLNTGAVLGCGVDVIYPSSNKRLAEKIIEKGGFLMSEFPVGTPPLQHHFPQRNRIVAGLSLGTVVVEAKEKSGALITARLAMEEGREVFAVPGQIFSALSAGPHGLIQSGAKLAQSAKDIVEELRPELMGKEKEGEHSAMPHEHHNILRALADGPLSAQEIIKTAEIEVSQLGSILTIMELEGTIRKMSSGEFERIE